MRCDVLVVGAGIGGASVASELSRHADVVLIEAEAQPGYHTTGRSAAFFAESYGGPLIRPLTTASGTFFRNPPEQFSDNPLISPRGCYHVFAAKDRGRAEKRFSAMQDAGLSSIILLSGDAVSRRIPVLRPDHVGGAIDDEGCRDLDVAAIHHGYLRQFKHHGGRLLCDAGLRTLEKNDFGWKAETSKAYITAKIVVNAAGAWADAVAQIAGAEPVGLSPMRRTIIIFHPRKVPVDNGWPVVIDFDERYYFKPEQGRILASPADETPMVACDVQPDEMDIAITVDRLLHETFFDVPHIENSWAGLRTFSPDRVPVVGPDPRVPGFVWCAGQGGYGIQVAPALAALTAAMTLGHDIPQWLAAENIVPERYAPARFAA